MLTIPQSNFFNHTSIRSSSCCTTYTKIRTARRHFSDQAWASLGKFQSAGQYFHADSIFSDLSEAFPNGEFSNLFRQDWLTAMARETRANKEFQQRTQETARWAREQIKRQSGKAESPCPVRL